MREASREELLERLAELQSKNKMLVNRIMDLRHALCRITSIGDNAVEESENTLRIANRNDED